MYICIHNAYTYLHLHIYIYTYTHNCIDRYIFLINWVLNRLITGGQHRVGPMGIIDLPGGCQRMSDVC